MLEMQEAASRLLPAIQPFILHRHVCTEPVLLSKSAALSLPFQTDLPVPSTLLLLPSPSLPKKLLYHWLGTQGFKDLHLLSWSLPYKQSSA